MNSCWCPCVRADDDGECESHLLSTDHLQYSLSSLRMADPKSLQKAACTDFARFKRNPLDPPG